MKRLRSPQPNRQVALNAVAPKDAADAVAAAAAAVNLRIRESPLPIHRRLEVAIRAKSKALPYHSGRRAHLVNPEA